MSRLARYVLIPVLAFMVALVGLNAQSAAAHRINIAPTAIPSAPSDTLDVSIVPLPPRAVARLGTGSLERVELSPDSKRIAVAGSAGVTVYDASSLKPLWAGRTSWVSAMKWSPDGKKLAAGSRTGTILVWDSLSGHPLYTLAGHHFEVTTLDWAPDSNRLLSSSIEGICIIWDFNTTTPPIS